MVKFLHAADLHLDSSLRGLESYEGAPVEAIRGATRRAFENLVRLATEEKVDFVLLAGDLYDGDWNDFNTGLYFSKQMNRLRDAGIRVFGIAGNHDAQSTMTRCLPLPDNVLMFPTESPGSHALDDLGVVIHGQGFPHQKVEENLARGYPGPVKDMFNIGLLHTCADGAEGHGRYAPCSPTELKSKEYDYWALGHVHTRQTLSERPYIAFPGNPQGRHVRETGEKGCLLVTVADGRKAVAKFRRLDVVRWERCEIEAWEAEHEDDLMAAVEARLRQLMDEEDPERLLAVRVEFRGPCRLHDRLLSDPVRTAAEVRNRAAALATGRDGDRLWIEQVKVTTKPMRDASPAGDGAFEELCAVLDELRVEGAGLTTAGQLLASLREPLRRAFLGVPDAPALDDPEWLRSAVDAAEALLRTRLMG
jgi:DNA repair exonuclease SbcCD nuclease subunit